MNNGLVTVILPIYNVEEYLDTCINSVVNQTYTNLEILLIDDGSPDNCPQICDEWAKKDSRIRVIHKQNQGLGMARNTGIDNATGEYICFFDSDDYVAQNTIESLYRLAKKESADLTVFGICSLNSRGIETARFVPTVGNRIYIGSEVLDEFLPDFIAPNPYSKEPRRFYMSSCLILYSLETIKKASWRFASEREIISEDVYSLLTLMPHINKVAVLPEALYYYRKNETSLSRKYIPDRYARIKHFYIACLDLCEKLGYDEEILHRVSKPYIAFTIAAIKQEISFNDSYSKVLRAIRHIIDDSLFQEVLRKNKRDVVGYKRRILFFTIRHKLYFMTALFLKLNG